MKNKRVSVSWLFEKDESDAPVKIRIGVTRRGRPMSPKRAKGLIMLVWGAAIIYALIYLFRHFV